MAQPQQHHEEAVHRRRGSGGGMGVLAILVALLFIVGPFAVPVQIPAMSQIILVAFGVFLLLAGSIVITITRLYRKAAADEAFVRTGMGGAKAIVDGGAIVIPVVHEVIPVSLKTMKLIVPRQGQDALITGDNLRADVIAEFFIKVQKDEKDVISAATSLGEKAIDPDMVQSTVFEKLVNALRTVAATKVLNDLHTKRDEFAQAVQTIVTADLKHNGLTLESVTISKLDQTPVKQLKEGAEDNVFDAQGARRVAEIINAAKVARNQLERQAEQQIATQNTTTAKFVYEQEVDRETAAAIKDKSIVIAKATNDSEAKQTSAAQAQLAGIAEVEKDKAVQVAGVKRDEAVAVANTLRDQTVRTAEIERDRTVEITGREASIAITQKETDLADAMTIRQQAEAAAEGARQSVLTVTVKATAERDREKTVIDQQAMAETEKIKKNMETDIKAYATTRDAEAEKTAADNKAAAKTTLAKADKDASVHKADGDQAVQMVPVNVLREKVAVERNDLDNKQQFQAISKDLSIRLAEIEASKEVQIALAGAMGEAFSRAKLTLWGTPEQAAQMMERFMTGQGFATMLNGLLAGPGGNGTDALGGVARVAAHVLKQYTGLELDPEQLGSLLSQARGGKPEAVATK